MVCTQCHAIAIPDALRCKHQWHRWRYISGLSDKMTDAELLAVLSADVAHLLRGKDAGDIA
jgi:hypothetical protein